MKREKIQVNLRLYKDQLEEFDKLWRGNPEIDNRSQYLRLLIDSLLKARKKR
jgi:hypothetical protein